VKQEKKIVTETKISKWGIEECLVEIWGESMNDSDTKLEILTTILPRNIIGNF
jgi:hypothetical protein